MAVEILGPIQIRSGASTAVPTPRLARLLLGLLALRANQSVPREFIVQALWGGQPPASAAANLRGYVTQLRRLLPSRTGGGVEICVDRAGYRLRADAASVDAASFMARVAGARAFAKAGDTGRALDEFAGALRLWRGPVFAGDQVPEPLQAEVNALQMRRLDVLEDWMDARLEAADHQAMCPELAVLTSGSPLREKLYGQLMLALSRCGRQGEALEVYRQLRQRLRDELGIDPSRQLQQLHQGLLRGDAMPQF